MRPTLALAIVSVLTAGPAESDETYLSDLLKRPAYRTAWNIMLRSEQDIPKWLARFARTSNGPSQPSTMITVHGQRYTAADVCQPHDCGDNDLHVLFGPGGGPAWGLLRESGRQRWLGHPDEEVRRAIAAVIQ